MNLSLVILHLFPNATPRVDYIILDQGAGSEIVRWDLPDPQPTQVELDAAWAVVSGATPAPSPLYAQLRRAAYPTIGDQLDALWKLVEELKLKDMPPETAAILETIVEVKETFPKLSEL